MIEDYLLNPDAFEVKGRGHIFHYPWGFVVRSPNDDLDEPQFFNLAAALRFLRVPPKECIQVTTPVARRFRIVGATQAFHFPSERFHTYAAADQAIGRLCFDYRLEHRLSPPPVEPKVEDARSGISASPKTLRDWGATIDTVHGICQPA